MTPTPLARHASTDDVCHRGDCVRCIRSRWLGAHPDRRLPAVPTSHRLVQVLEVAR